MFHCYEVDVLPGFPPGSRTGNGEGVSPADLLRQKVNHLIRTSRRGGTADPIEFERRRISLLLDFTLSPFPVSAKCTGKAVVIKVYGDVPKRKFHKVSNIKVDIH